MKTKARHRNRSLIGLIAERAQPWHKILAFLISAGAVGGGAAWFERTYGPVAGTMGWLRQIDMLRHEDKHAIEVRKAVEPVASKVTTIDEKLDAIKEERIYFDYKRSSWDILALESKLAKEHTLSREDYERLTDLRTENARLKQWLESRPIDKARAPIAR